MGFEGHSTGIFMGRKSHKINGFASGFFSLQFLTLMFDCTVF